MYYFASVLLIIKKPTLGCLGVGGGWGGGGGYEGGGGRGAEGVWRDGEERFGWGIEGWGGAVKMGYCKQC